MKLSELYLNPLTGKLSVSRLACSVAHAQAACWFGYLSYAHGFNLEMWIAYLGFATGHNVAGKVVAAYRDKPNATTV